MMNGKKKKKEAQGHRLFPVNGRERNLSHNGTVQLRDRISSVVTEPVAQLSSHKRPWWDEHFCKRWATPNIQPISLSLFILPIIIHCLADRKLRDSQKQWSRMGRSPPSAVDPRLWSFSALAAPLLSPTQCAFSGPLIRRAVCALSRCSCPLIRTLITGPLYFLRHLVFHPLNLKSGLTE